MFKPVRPRSVWRKTKNLFWPDMGFSRLMVYYRYRLGRLPGTAGFIAAGVATGIAISFTPFMGFHIFMGALLCWMMRASLLGMAVGTVIGGNPWTFPVIWLVTYKLGHLILGHSDPSVPEFFSFSLLIENPLKVLLPMSVGCIPFVIVSWLLSFYLFRRVVIKYKQAQRLHGLGKKT